jgi:hypothetical protein
MSELLNDAENEALDMTVKLWNSLVLLEKLNESELKEYEFLIHSIQGRIMSRPVRREING